MHARPKWQREVARAAYRMLRDEYGRRHHRAVTLAELSQQVFGCRESSFIANAMRRGQIPSGLVLKRMRALCPPAARLVDLVPAVSPTTSTADLRELFASGVTDLDLSDSALVVDLAHARDIVFAPGVVRAIHSPRWVSRLLLEVLLLRRRADRDVINVVLMQAWQVGAALLDCVFQFPTLRALANPVWLAIADDLLPDIDAVQRYSGVVDSRGQGLVLNECWVSRLTRDRTRLQTCVADALSMTETPLRVRHLFPDPLGLELYFHLTYRPSPTPEDEAEPDDTSHDGAALPSASATSTWRADWDEASGANSRHFIDRPHAVTADHMSALRPLLPDTEPRFLVPKVRPPTNADGSLRARHRRGPLGKNLVPLLMEKGLARSLRIGYMQSLN